MSQSTAKATRRDLRRAVGVEAMDILEAHAQYIQQLQQQFNALAFTLNTLTGQVNALRRPDPMP